MSFTDVPPGCTHSSRAVHPVLFRPHLRRSSHTTRHVRTPHTLSNMHYSSSSSHNGAHSSSSMLPIGQEVVTFFLSFFFSFCQLITVFPSHAASCEHQCFPFDWESCFPFHLDDGEQNVSDKPSFLPPACRPPSCPSLPVTYYRIIWL